MSDLGLLSDIAKIVGGGMVGGFGTLLSQRNKRRKFRRGLYRELLRNYSVVRSFIDKAKKMPGLNAPLRGVTVRVEAIGTDYYEYAKKDMDTFSELSEAATLDWFYRSLDSLVQIVPSGANGAVPLFNNACQLVHTVEENFVGEGLSIRVARKVLRPSEIRYLEERIESMRATGIPDDEHPLADGQASPPRTGRRILSPGIE